MAQNPVRLNRKGVGKILKGDGLDLSVVNECAEKIAGGVRAELGDDVEVLVEKYTTDRGAASVTIKDSKAMQLQARTGILTRHAAAAGLEVN